MSQNVNDNGLGHQDSNKPMSAALDNKCDREGCCNIATMKPVVQLRESPVHEALESFFGLKVCSSCATQENADRLIETDEQKLIFENIFKVQQVGDKEVDWSCSGVVWVKIQ